MKSRQSAVTHLICSLQIALSFLVLLTGIAGKAQDTVVNFTGMRYDAANPANSLIVNPERGFRDEIMFEVSGVYAPMWGTVHFNQLPGKAAATRSHGGSVIQTYFYLYKYYNTDIPASAIANMRTILDAYRANGIKALLRFCYDTDNASSSANYRYTVQDIQRHIAQVKPFMEEYKDVIYAFQMGWVGAWGEWHTSYYGHENYPAATAAISQSFFAAMPLTHKATFRQPKFKNNSGLSGYDYNYRAGFHNDFFTLDMHSLAIENDYTYYTSGGSVNPVFTQVRDEAATSIMDGEMPYSGTGNSWLFNDITDGFKVLARMYAHKYSTFSFAHNFTPNIQAWKNQSVAQSQVSAEGIARFDYSYFRNKSNNVISRSAYDLIRDHLGYRLIATQAKYPPRIAKGEVMPLRLFVKNVGMATPVKDRSAYFVLIDPADGSIIERSSAINFGITRMFSSSTSSADSYIKQIDGEIATAGLIEGKQYLLGFWLPDASASISDSANYSIRLANEETTWFSPDNRYGVNIYGTVAVNATLPVSFGSVFSEVSKNTLRVNWSTIWEKNNDRFIVEASADGEHFTSLGELKSSAADGNSDKALTYSFSKDMPSVTALLGLSLLLLGCRVPASGSMRRILLPRAVIIATLLCIGILGCSRRDTAFLDTSAALFIRIKQVDKDSSFKYSKVVKVTYRQ